MRPAEHKCQTIMNKETKTKYAMSIGCFIIGTFYLLEGLRSTHFGEKTEGTPDFIIALVGFSFLLASIMILVGKKERLNNFLASILIFIMGLMSGWVSLFGKSSNFSGDGALLSLITDLPVDRIMFGFGSIMSFVVSIIAFRMFLKPKLPEK